ncbi:hypothetical protein KBTX_03696 [wastewater metagenome]|uniref:Uncharacterized protein n=2 Tax=unclassified sequences TaxID=12908 RepID=A0A5B8RKC1_9ZZZZ|nr:hypothetical protein KBTEX_03696 [uncultured organism]
MTNTTTASDEQQLTNAVTDVQRDAESTTLGSAVRP